MNIRKIATAALFATTLALVTFNANAQTMKSDTMGMASSYKLASVGAPTTGSVEIVEKGGKTTITLQNLKTEAGPDLHVYLYADAVPAKTAKKLSAKFVDLGKLAAPFKGNFSYKVPANTNLFKFKSLIIWCDVAKVTFAGAKLK
jgi:Cu/Zn superoxide dismutase